MYRPSHKFINIFYLSTDQTSHAIYSHLVLFIGFLERPLLIFYRLVIFSLIYAIICVCVTYLSFDLSFLKCILSHTQ